MGQCTASYYAPVLSTQAVSRRPHSKKKICTTTVPANISINKTAHVTHKYTYLFRAQWKNDAIVDNLKYAYACANPNTGGKQGSAFSP